MVKRISVGKKNPAMTKEEFKTYYLKNHAPLFLRTFPEYVLKYVVNFSIDQPGKENPFDYVTEIYFKDVETRNKMRQTEECKTILRPDEIRMGAISQGGWFEEFIKKPGDEKYMKNNKMIKRIVVGTKDPAKKTEEFKRYYLEQHASLFLKTIPYVRKYVINLAMDILFEGKKNPFDSVIFSYWDDIETDNKYLQSEEYKNIIKPDGVKLGIQTSIRAYCEEHIMKDF